MSKFTAPVGDSKKIDNVELIPRGLQLCTLFGLVDVGTQKTNFGDKHQVKLSFEFPQHYRKYYEDRDPQPAAIFCTEALSMNKESNLRKKFIQPMIGKVFTDEEAENFDISELLGKNYVASVSHSPDGKWANIDSIIPLDGNNVKMFGIELGSVRQINNTEFFHLSEGFESRSFGLLGNYFRDLLIGSEEGRKHSAKGGKFHEKVDNSGQSQNNQVSGPPSSNGKIKMNQGEASYEEYIKVGWTDELLIQHGKATKIEPVAPPSVAPPPSKIAPPPAVKRTLVFKDQNSAPLEDWLKGGWTEERIVEEGHAVFQ